MHRLQDSMFVFCRSDYFAARQPVVFDLTITVIADRIAIACGGKKAATATLADGGDAPFWF